MRAREFKCENIYHIYHYLCGARGEGWDASGLRVDDLWTSAGRLLFLGLVPLVAQTRTLKSLSAYAREKCPRKVRL